MGIEPSHCRLSKDQGAKALGSKRVVYTDFDEDRLALAKRLGAEVLSLNYKARSLAPDQFPIVVDASNLPDGLIFALLSTAPCGICTGISPGQPIMDGIPLAQMYMKGITYNVSRVHARHAIPTVLECAR